MKLSIKEKNRLQSKYGPWAIVTGGSSGIGKELTLRLAESGLNIILVARNLESLEKTKYEIENLYPVKTENIQADLSTSEGVSTVIKETQSQEIGLLVNSAGFGTSGLFVESDLKKEQNMLAVNCEAVLSLTHYFSQRFKEQKRGGIIFLSSIVGFQGVPNAAHYAATKAYIQSLAEALSLELKPYGIDTLSAAPGPVHSGFANRANMDLGSALKPEDIGIPILNALGKKTNVYPGMLTKILTYSLKTVPRWAKVRIMNLVMSGMTKHQHP